MPNHVHVILTVGSDTTIESAVGLIKGRFSYRLKDELGYMGEVWRPGFSEERIDTLEALRRCQQYIAENPVKAGLAKDPDEYPCCFRYLAKKKARG
jgi:putative transposase